MREDLILFKLSACAGNRCEKIGEIAEQKARDSLEAYDVKEELLIVEDNRFFRGNVGRIS